MPTILKAIPETYNNITRPIATSIVRDLINRFNLPSADTIQFAGSASTIAQAGSVLASKNNDPLFPFRGKVIVELVENYLEETALHNDLLVDEHQPVFEDSSLGVKIAPSYFTTESVITFTYHSKSKTEVLGWRNKLRNKTKLGMESLLHEIIYHYSLPPEYTAILNEIYNKRESIHGYGETYEEWLSENFSDYLSVVLNLDGSRALPSISEKQIRVQGWFDFEDQPEKPEKTEDGDLWALTFSYTFRYDKVNSLLMQYPIIVHNNLLDAKYLPLEAPYDLHVEEKRYSRSGRDYNYFSLLDYDVGTTYSGIKIPSYDDFIPLLKSKYHIPIVTALVAVDLDQPELLLNLTALGSTAISPTVLEHIRKNRNKVTVINNDVYLVNVYRHGDPLDHSEFHIDENLNIVMDVPLDPRDIHHVRLSLLVNLRQLSKPGYDTLVHSPIVTKQVVDTIEILSNPKTVDRVQATIPSISSIVNPTDRVDTETPDLPDPYFNIPIENVIDKPLSNNLKVLGNKVITPTSLDSVIKRVNTGISLSGVGNGRGLKTVMVTGIIAKMNRK